MIGSALLALSVAAATPSRPASQLTIAPKPAAPQRAAAAASSLLDAAHAIRVGRLEQARLMIGRAVGAGANGREVDRLLADLAFASGNDDEALVRYRLLIAANPNDSILVERAGITALKLGDLLNASFYIERATKGPAPSWRAWNARGVVADLQRDFPAADAAYAQAARMAPRESEVTNNRGWSQLLRGDWAQAVGLFEQAVASDPASSRMANNLELARAALASELPQRKPGESDGSWAARLNDAGVAAQIMGDRQRAIAAFTQALDASGVWYARAANNLQAASAK